MSSRAAVRSAAAAATAWAVSRDRRLRGAPALTRANHRGAAVSLASGPAVALGAVVGAGLPLPAVGTAALAALAVGAYDDAVGGRPDQVAAKGLRGHAAALRHGRVTSGAVKVAGLGTAGLAAAVLLPGRPRPADALLAGAVVAGCANLVNLLDLRPGRALKVGVAGALAVGRPGVAAAAAALLPDDLAERTMLGDAGANALGAVLGLALVERRPDRPALLAALAALAGLTGASELVSFSRVIEATPPLRWLDGLGRQPAAPPPR